MAKRAQPGLSCFMLLDKICPLDGALPICWDGFDRRDRHFRRPGGDKDTACAKVGMDKIARYLN